MEEIKLDNNNYRIHNDRNKKIINDSLKNYGAGRSILLDADGVIIAGNGTYEQAKNLGIPIKIIKSDGKELIAVKRVDLSTKDKKRSELAVMDNAASDSSKFDVSKLSNDFSVNKINSFGVPVAESSVPLDAFFEPKKQKEKKVKKVKCPFCGEQTEV